MLYNTIATRFFAGAGSGVSDVKGLVHAGPKNRQRVLLLGCATEARPPLSGRHRRLELSTITQNVILYVSVS